MAEITFTKFFITNLYLKHLKNLFFIMLLYFKLFSKRFKIFYKVQNLKQTKSNKIIIFCKEKT